MSGVRGRPVNTEQNDRVMRLLLDGLTRKEIADQERLTYTAVRSIIWREKKRRERAIYAINHRENPIKVAFRRLFRRRSPIGYSEL